MTVKTNMEMPRNCWDCKFGVASNASLFCPFLGTVVIDNPRMRDDDCPCRK